LGVLKSLLSAYYVEKLVLQAGDFASKISMRGLRSG
jgi:hypothetical protein